ncbi:MAG: gamma-glutamyl-gamma-aminobutyrate hydrolase family protein [Candidatus Dormibacteraeota bacterium]|nr:gamma-glutamyl-gamma-aminobutyrate hydrolase family protein [Candidatus Dormibacteraeota bacterium]MBV8445109.1 gamma-glutamyl-gamma-aminobutyrate hydrolase family protein [Candidatus Dormibacteraeota bacterium]
MSGPLIGVTLHGEARDGVPRRFIRNRAYIDALHAEGAAVIGIAPGASADALRTVYERCDALLLPGGPDVEPSRYGAATDPTCNVDTDCELDAMEFALAGWALADGKPVLGICRGLQVINVALGGTLWQDVRSQRDPAQHHPDDQRWTALAHEVRVTPGSFLHRVTGETSLRVNSLHHQGIRELAEELSAAGCSPDGLVEAVEARGRRFVAAVQWHPEAILAEAPWGRSLFTEFVTAARG